MDTNKNTRGMGLSWLAVLLLPATAALAEWAVPDALQPKVDALSDRQQAFILTGAAIDIIPERQLTHELATRDAASMAQLIDDLMAAAAQMGYSADRDMGAAPLNLATKNWVWATPTPPGLRKLEREPGPFGVHRYLFPKSGVPTFGGAKVAIWPEDLVAGKVSGSLDLKRGDIHAHP